MAPWSLRNSLFALIFDKTNIMNIKKRYTVNIILLDQKFSSLSCGFFWKTRISAEKLIIFKSPYCQSFSWSTLTQNGVYFFSRNWIREKDFLEEYPFRLLDYFCGILEHNNGVKSVGWIIIIYLLVYIYFCMLNVYAVWIEREEMSVKLGIILEFHLNSVIMQPKHLFNNIEQCNFLFPKRVGTLDDN